MNLGMPHPDGRGKPGHAPVHLPAGQWRGRTFQKTGDSPGISVVHLCGWLGRVGQLKAGPAHRLASPENTKGHAPSAATPRGRALHCAEEEAEAKAPTRRRPVA